MNSSLNKHLSDNATTEPKPVVFFDGGCPMCRREIDHYRRLRGADRLEWIDISRDDAGLARHGLHRSIAMARFHVLDRRGVWQTGAWGFAEMWSHLPTYRWLARIVRTLRLLPLIDRAYVGFAAWRLRRRCNADTCEVRG